MISDMKKTILLTNHYEGQPRSILTALAGDDYNLKMLDDVTQEALEEAIPEADFLLVSGRLHIGENSIRKAVRLKMIQRTGVGLDNMDLECFRRHNIPLYVNYGINASSVAEHTIMMILAVLRRCYFVNNQLRRGIWKKQETGLTTHELSGKTVGIIGAGNIGKAVAGLLSGFNVEIIYYDERRLTLQEEERLKMSYVSLDELFMRADVVTLHCSLKSGSQFLISDRELGRMKNKAVLINTARGKLVDTNALVKALSEGKLAGCGIDTYENEPINEENPLLKFDNVILSPHIAGVTYESFSHMLEAGIRNIRNFDEGRLELIESNRVV